MVEVKLYETGMLTTIWMRATNAGFCQKRRFIQKHKLFPIHCNKFTGVINRRFNLNELCIFRSSCPTFTACTRVSSTRGEWVDRDTGHIGILLKDKYPNFEVGLQCILTFVFLYN